MTQDTRRLVQPMESYLCNRGRHQLIADIL
jgi:hypothetical protein